MTSANDIDSDDYVAKLLAEDAKNSSIKYSSMGLSALLPKRPINGAPKPNTRFLQSILRETDSHNAALKRKEELEARMRLRGIIDEKTQGGEVESRAPKRKRVDDDRGLDSRDHKKRSHRSQWDDDGRARRRDRHEHRRPHKNRRGEVESSGDYRATKIRRRSSSPRGKDRRKRSPIPERHRRRRRRRDSPSSSSESDHHRSQRHKQERRSEDSRSDRRRASSSTTHLRHNSPPPRNRRNKHLSSRDPPNAKTRSPPSFSFRSPPTRSISSSSSDPLESIVGPLPPPVPTSTKSTPLPPFTSRGRGTTRPTSTIDTHFTPSYDPTLDLHPSHPSPSSPTKDPQEDWDLALEALRDRQLWKKKGAERLREAGFAEEEVRKWESSATGKEKDVEDVRWRGKGEEREWDAGKVVVDDEGQDGAKARKGEVGLEAAWNPKRRGRGGGLLGEMRRALG